MKPSKYINTFLFIILFLCGCRRNFSVLPVENEWSPPRSLTTLEKTLVESDNTFGFRLFREIVRSENEPNIFISPLSVHMALGMALNGAAGTTEEAMKNTLAFEGMTGEEINKSFKSLIDLLSGLDPKVIFEIANSIWYRQGFQILDSFIQTNRDYFNAEVRSLDFSSQAAKDIINGWVNEKTHGKIEEIIDEIHPLSMLFLINAIYFKGMWTYQFDKSKTVDAPFAVPDGSQVTVKMMRQETELAYFETDEFQAVDLPYGNDLYSMTILLPKEGRTPEALIENLSHETWADWMSRFTKTTLTLAMPKFKMAYELKMNDVLTAMGMGIAFRDSADFTRIHDPRDLYISQVRHKSFIEVDEEGTEAAAVTVVEFRTTSVNPYMRIDRPFFFAIREKHSGTLLFMGKISDPSSNE